MLCHRQAQHGAVGQQSGGVDGLLHQGGGVAGTFAITGIQGQQDLVSLQMVLHGTGIGGAVIEHGAVGVNPGDAAAFDFQFIQIFQTLVGNRLGSQNGLVLELVPLDAGIVGIEGTHDDDQTGKENRQGNKTDGSENTPCHERSSIR